MPKGGKQPGAGRPAGSLNQSTLRKLAIRNRILARFEKDADAIYDAQLAQALGTKFLVARDKKTGKFIPLDEEKTALMLKCGQAESVEIWDRPPSTQAAQFLSDRAIDRPTEHQEVTGKDGGPLIVKWKE
jgi:hypothetical protein